MATNKPYGDNHGNGVCQHMASAIFYKYLISFALAQAFKSLSVCLNQSAC